MEVLMKNRLIAIFLNFTFLCGFTSCSSEQREEMKQVTAKSLGSGMAAIMMNESISGSDKVLLECQDKLAAEKYFIDKACNALKADCSPDLELVRGLSAKGVVTRFICKSAVKIVLPIAMPSNFLPQELKAAGCVSNYADNLASELSDKLCSKL